MAWKSFVRKRYGKDKIKEEAIKQIKERDANFKENWQKWNDEHRED